MSSSPLVWIFNLTARLPLGVLHRLGALLGWAVYRLSGNFAARLHENLARGLAGNSAAEFDKVLHDCVTETGKGVAELPWIWRRPLSEVLATVKACHGWEYVETAHADGKGLIVLTPHLACFEIIAIYIAARMPMTCMYRVPKLAWLDTVMREARQRGHMSLARADVGGVRTLYKALKRGEIIGVLPDQVPGNGEGEWADFFGRPAYTMTLIGRLQKNSGAKVLMSYVVRLPRGQGYELHFAPLEFDEKIGATQQINAALERTILTCPSQYLWSYNRYKVPAGAEPPPQANTSGGQR